MFLREMDMSAFTEPLEKGWLRKVSRECQLRMAAYRKVEAMTLKELAAFTEDKEPIDE